MDDKTFTLLKDMGGAVKNAMAQVAESLGVASEHVYTVLVRQQIVVGLVSLVINIAFIILMSVLIRKYFKQILIPTINGEDETKKYVQIDNDGLSIALGLVLAICTMILTIATCVSLPTTMGQLINPEYYAIQNIFSFIKGVVGK